MISNSSTKDYNNSIAPGRIFTPALTISWELTLIFKMISDFYYIDSLQCTNVSSKSKITVILS